MKVRSCTKSLTGYITEAKNCYDKYWANKITYRCGNFVVFRYWVDLNIFSPTSEMGKFFIDTKIWIREKEEQNKI